MDPGQARLGGFGFRDGLGLGGRLGSCVWDRLGDGGGFENGGGFVGRGVLGVLRLSGGGGLSRFLGKTQCAQPRHAVVALALGLLFLLDQRLISFLSGGELLLGP
ncbi:hypothetical protein AAFN88_15920 [Pelagibius sp. CAU 1746]|uniref:hypothetical protein n=1 Tax=Pelagibius sp. CAU 1746 TaxID=3140370 RepID=UPI00325B26EF